MRCQDSAARARGRVDPEFALAHAGLGVCYSGTGQRQLAIQSATRAYERRQRTTDPERFFIEYVYDRDVTGDLERAFRAVTRWTQAYPRDLTAHGLRGGDSARARVDEDVIESAELALAIELDFVFAHSESVSANMFLDRFDAAKRALQRAGAVVDPPALALGYYIALLEHDTGSMERVAARFKDSSDPELLRHAQSLALARAGQLERARTLGREAIDATEALGRRETRQSTNRRRRCGKRCREISQRPGGVRRRPSRCRVHATSAMPPASHWPSRGRPHDRNRWPTISSADFPATRSSGSRMCRRCARSRQSGATSRSGRSNCCRQTSLTACGPADGIERFFGSLYPV